MDIEPQVTKKTLKIGSTLYEISRPWVMGIVNVTPDSFYAESRTSGAEEFLMERVRQLVDEGVDILDVGGYSTRPGAAVVSTEMELNRVVPAIRLIKKYYPALLISIDTFRADVAVKAVEAGADMINDVSGGDLDASMFDAVAALGVPYILMHMRGTPSTMNSLAHYNHLVKDVLLDLHGKLQVLQKKGVMDIIVDPGFGFAKSIPQNFELMRNLSAFHVLERPLLVGVSRKAMVWRSLGVEPEGALNGTTVLHTVALQQGASILRVHDVKAAVEVVTIFRNLYPES